MIVDSHMHVGDLPVFDVAIELAEHNLNVYLETSGIPMRSKIREAVKCVGPDRALYGSDTPFHHPSVELAKVRVSGLSTGLTERGRRMTASVNGKPRGRTLGTPGRGLVARAPGPATRTTRVGGSQNDA